MRLGIADVQLQRLRKRLDRFGDLLLPEERVAQSVVSPPGRGMLLEIRSQQGLDFLEPLSPDVIFEKRDLPRVILLPRPSEGHAEQATRFGRRGTQSDGFPKRLD